MFAYAAVTLQCQPVGDSVTRNVFCYRRSGSAKCVVIVV